MITYPSILTSERLIAKVKERFDLPANLSHTAEGDTIHKKVFSFLLNWIVNFHYDFDENIIEQFKELLNYIKSSDQTSLQFTAVINHLFKEVEKKTANLETKYSTSYALPSSLPTNLFCLLINAVVLSDLYFDFGLFHANPNNSVD